jgi:FAD binding domain-containing protein
VTASISETSYDLIVIGGGLAGLTAAVRAAELGLRPIVLEQGDGEDYPCNTRQSGGILHIGFHDPFRPAPELAGIIAKMTDGEARPNLAAALSDNGSRLISWLQDHGARFMRFNQQEGYRWCMAPPRALRAGIDWNERGPDMVMRRLARQLAQLGGTLQLRTRATGLVMKGATCIGAHAETGGQEKTWLAPHCLIADGGFQSNHALYEQHIGPDFGAVFQRGARTGKGVGLEMARAAGAALTETNRFYGHLLCRDSLTNDKIWPYPELDAIATSGLVVDGSGRRIVDEGRTGIYIANELAAFPAESRFHVIFDKAIWDGPGTSARIPANPLLEQAGGTVLRADTLEQLAAIIGVAPSALQETIHGYNAALANGTLGQLAVPRSEKIKPHKVAEAPFMAIPLLPGITYTMGGIATDEHAQVLDRNGAPIPGLFAAGATTGGLEGGENAVYIGGLIKAGVFGLLSAERIAVLQKKSVPPVPISQLQPERDGGTARGRSPTPDVPRGLARYPVLRATLRYGRPAAFAIAIAVALLVMWLGWSPLGLVAPLLAILIGAAVAFAILSYTELVRLITELLMPD